MRFNIQSLESQLEKHGFKRSGKGKTPEEAIISAYDQMRTGENIRGMEFYVTCGTMLGGRACEAEEDAQSYWCYVRGMKH